jgi:hypothetical protein
MVAKTQTLEGVTSLQSDGLHVIMFDSVDDCDLHELKNVWKRIQHKYGLSDIFIVSDKIGSYRVWCFTHVKFNVLLHILTENDVFSLMDYNFFYWTVTRSKATLRISNKVGRELQKTVTFLKSYPVKQEFFVEKELWEKVVYDTGIEKKGINILLGEKVNG